MELMLSLWRQTETALGGPASCADVDLVQIQCLGAPSMLHVDA